MKMNGEVYLFLEWSGETS